MKTGAYIRLIIISTILIILFTSCREFLDNITDPLIPPTAKKLPYTEMSENEIPPCLELQGEAEVVLRSPAEYNLARVEYAPQGEYITFEGDGINKNFELPYIPVDLNGDGVIDLEEINIYVTGADLYANINGEHVRVSSNPVMADGDSIFVFRQEYPYTVERKIYYKNVLTIDPVTGAVTFVVAPADGARIIIGGKKQLYDRYNGRDCSMDYYDFENKTYIAKYITGNGCLRGLEKEIYIDHTNNEVKYYWKRLVTDNTGGCPEILISFGGWISVEGIPNGYKIKFVEGEPVIVEE